jgi:hypothetical protein
MSAFAGGAQNATAFLVEITNTSAPAPVLASGVFSVPDGAVDPGVIAPGGAYTFTVYASPEQRLSFASMFVQSNDWLLVTPPGGIDLHDASGNPLSGDFSDQLLLVDAGTEIDQTPGTGLDQAPRQSGPDTGAADPNPNLRTVPRDPSTDITLTITSESAAASSPSASRTRRRRS